MPEIVGVVHSLLIRVVLRSITPHLSSSHHFDFPTTTSPVPPLLVRRTRVRLGPEKDPSSHNQGVVLLVESVSPALMLLVGVVLLY